MKVYEKNIKLNIDIKNTNLKELESEIKEKIDAFRILRFVIKSFNKKSLQANILYLKNSYFPLEVSNIFDTSSYIEIDNNDEFNTCFIIPTGINCDIGGHAGDANTTLKLVSSLCDNVVTHPNVVNASDINEMPSNCLYLEGSLISKFLNGSIALEKVRKNKLLCIIEDDKENNYSFENLAINSVESARTILGLETKIVRLKSKLHLKGKLVNGIATGEIKSRLHDLYEIINDNKDCDAIAITSKIKINKKLRELYNKSHGQIANPWGAVESMLTHFISSCFDKPSAHAPMCDNEEEFKTDYGVVDPKIAPEIISNAFFYCVLKGLYQAPKINDIKSKILPSGLHIGNISAIVIPDGTLSLSILQAKELGIKVIAVKNKNLMKNNLKKLDWKPGQFYQCENYFEACGILQSIKLGVSKESLCRPLLNNDIII